MNYKLSNVTRSYLEEFQTILNTMISAMTDVCPENSISYNFIVRMLPHHEAAIRMSENLLRYTTSIALQNIALGIIEEQTKSIDDMNRILSSCKDVTNCDRDLRRYECRTEQIIQTMFSEMKNARSDNCLNLDFIREMIPHHRGAVLMSKNALQYPICPGLRPILLSIICSQEKGIYEMECLQKRICC